MQETFRKVPSPETNPDRDPTATGDRPARRDVLGESARVSDITTVERERLVRLAHRVMWNRNEAEDAVQEALLAAHTKDDQLRDGGKRWSWLCRIVVRECYEHGRQQQRRARHQEAYSISPRQVYDTRDPAGSLQRADVRELVHRAIPKLSPRQQQVLILKDLEGMEYAEVAEILLISPSTARVHAKDAREALRDLIKQDHPEAFRSVFSG